MVSEAVTSVVEVSPKTSTTDNISNKTSLQRELDSNAFISTVADLKEQAPELFHRMQEGIGLKICAELRRHAARMCEIHRRGRAGL